MPFPDSHTTACGKALGDDGKRDRRPLARLDAPTKVEVGMGVGQPVVGGDDDLPRELLELPRELTVDLLECAPWSLARVAELVDRRKHGEDDPPVLAQCAAELSTTCDGRPGPSDESDGLPPTRGRGSTRRAWGGPSESGSRPARRGGRRGSSPSCRSRACVRQGRRNSEARGAGTPSA